MRYIYSKSENKFEISEFIAYTETQRFTALKAGYIEVSDEDYKRLANHELCWKDGILVPYAKTEEELIADKEQKEAAVIADQINTLKAELAKVKEDIEQETFGIIRTDFSEKKIRAAEIINELRVLEGKPTRETVYGGEAYRTWTADDVEI